jgi:hypothetical protein
MKKELKKYYILMPSDALNPMSDDFSVAVTGGYYIANTAPVTISTNSNTGPYINNYASTESVDYKYIEMQRELRKMSEEIAELKKELIETEKYIQNEEIRNLRKIKV